MAPPRFEPSPEAPFTPPEAAMLFLLCAALMIVVGATMQRWGLWGIAASEWVIFLVPPVLAARARGSVAVGLGLVAPPGRDVAAALLLGASSWFLNLWLVLPLQELVMPMPEELARELESLLIPEGASTAALLFSIALTPAICEEVLCRGVVARCLARLGSAVAIVVSAALFAALHFSVYRFVPTFLLGILLGWVTLRATRRSIVPAMIVHGLNNAAVLLTTAAFPSAGQAMAASPHVFAAVAVLTFAAGLLLFATKKRS